MNDYANAKGKANRPSEVASSSPGGAPKPLSPEEREAVAKNRAFVHENMPELVPFIQELHQLGLIDGWRSVIRCKKD